MLTPRLPLTAIDARDDMLPLVEIIELKWLMAGEGIHLHVERLQRDPAYARRALDQAAASASPALRAVAARLRERLAPRP